MPTCRIIFSGLCAFVPHDGSFLNPSDPPTSITALLPNVLSPTPIDLGDIIVSPHFPLLEFKLQTELPGDTANFLRFVRPVNQDSKGLFPLAGREVEIWIDGRLPSPSGIDCIHRPQDDPDFADDDLYWLIALDEVYERPCAIDPALLRSLVGLGDIVTTRLRLTTGTFMTYEITEEPWHALEIGSLAIPENDLVVQRPDKSFARVSGAPDIIAGRKVATKMALEFEFTREVAFVVKGFGGKEPGRLVFALPDDRPNEAVEIVVKNLEANEHFGIPEDLSGLIVTKKGSSGGPSYLVAPEYEIYYNLLIFDGPRADIVRRVLISLLSAAGVGKPCSPVSVPQNLPTSELQAVRRSENIDLGTPSISSQEKAHPKKGLGGRTSSNQTIRRGRAGRRGG